MQRKKPAPLYQETAMRIAFRQSITNKVVPVDLFLKVNRCLKTTSGRIVHSKGWFVTRNSK